MKYLFLLLALSLTMPVLAETPPAKTDPRADPSVAQIQAVMGPQSAVERTGPGEYVIDEEHVTLQQLLTTVLPQKETALKTIEDNIKQRQTTAKEIASGMSIEAKRAKCQALPTASIDHTRCYQELEDLRDQQAQSAEDIADKQKDDELQNDRLQQEIDAIDQFSKQYGGK